MKKIVKTTLAFVLILSALCTPIYAETTIYGSGDSVSTEITGSTVSEERFNGAEDSSVIGFEVSWGETELEVKRNENYGVIWNPETLQWDKNSNVSCIYELLNDTIDATIINRSLRELTFTGEFVARDGLELPGSFTITSGSVVVAPVTVSGNAVGTKGTLAEAGTLRATYYESNEDYSALYNAIQENPVLGTYTIRVSSN